ncbi:MAG: Aspartate racemase [Firmicutes bacterium]|nr:Aspartate racemase [Bacillota bacterium]
MNRGIVGILGGMGPQATIDFYQRILDNTKAARDQEHLQVLLWSDPQVPDRTAAILGTGEDPTARLVSGAERLCLGGATCIAVPCNTAHYFLPKVQQAVPTVPIFDMVATAVNRVQAHLPQGSKIGVAATDGTLASGLYQRAMLSRGLLPVLPSLSEQAVVMDIIYGQRGVKAGYLGRANEERFRRVVAALCQRGAAAILVGCTELSMVATRLVSLTTVFDPMEILAQAVVEQVKGHHDYPVSWVSYP